MESLCMGLDGVQGTPSRALSTTLSQMPEQAAAGV